MVESMEPGFDYRIEGVVKGYHAYRQATQINEILDCKREYHNPHDCNAVRVVKRESGTIVGRVPWGFSAAFSCFISNNKAKIIW